jgi:hypothetical protein
LPTCASPSTTTENEKWKASELPMSAMVHAGLPTNSDQTASETDERPANSRKALARMQTGDLEELRSNEGVRAVLRAHGLLQVTRTATCDNVDIIFNVRTYRSCKHSWYAVLCP